MHIIRQLLRLIACCLLLLAIAINKNHRVLGTPTASSPHTVETEKQDEWTTPDGYRVISTENLAKDIIGYAGNIPLHIYLMNDTVCKIEVQPNAESPRFLSSVIKSGLLGTWNGLSPHEVISKEVDAVTGATFTSSAIIASVQKGMQYAARQTQLVGSITGVNYSDWRFWCVLTVVLSGMLVPFVFKNKYFRMAQLVMNVVVLGFWSGSFISLSLLINYMSNGIHLWEGLVPILLLTVMFIFPLFGRKSHYCMWVCPLGSCQELMGKAVPYKLKISSGVMKYLNILREALWIGIMGVIWMGAGLEILDYELFTAFMFEQASVPVLVAAMLFAVLSCVVHRPYCRFVCPTGGLVRFAQRTK